MFVLISFGNYKMAYSETLPYNFNFLTGIEEPYDEIDSWFDSDDSDSEEQDWRFGDGFCDDDLNTMENKYDGGDCCLPDTKFGVHSFCTECQCLEEYDLLECNTDGDCPSFLNQCNIMAKSNILWKKWLLCTFGL